MTATLTYEQWRDLGRQVRKGEKSERGLAVAAHTFRRILHELQGIEIEETTREEARAYVEPLLSKRSNELAPLFGFAQTDAIRISGNFQPVPDLGVLLEQL